MFQDARLAWVADTFASSNIRKISQGLVPPQIEYLIGSTEQELSLKQALSRIYEFLLPRYRNEYIFRNEIINSIYDSRHDLSVAHMFCEFAVGRSRTDLVVVNGTTTCYEIKTNIDTLRRLESQIGDYTRFFDRVFVAVSEERICQAREVLDENIGILVFDDSKNVWQDRAAESNMHNLDPIIIFNALHQREQVLIASKIDPNIMELNAVDSYFRARDIFSSFSPHQAHSEFMNAIKERKSQRLDAQFEQLPRSLANAYLATKMSSRMWADLIARLHIPLGD